jgi:hypothetical protein
MSVGDSGSVHHHSGDLGFEQLAAVQENQDAAMPVALSRWAAYNTMKGPAI